MKYYSTQRPITPGNYPKSPFKEVLNIVNFDSRMYCEEIGQEAWGYIEYKAPLHPKDAMEYELMPVPDKIIHVSFIGVDSWGHRVYKDEMGRLWKYCDPGERPEERHDGLFRASSNDPDGEPDYPLRGDMDYRIKDTEGFYGNVSQKQVCRDQE